MKANELMIDDLVYCHKPECKGHRIDYIHEADEEVGADGEIYSINDIDPIPLTQEILEKNGFIEINDDEKWYKMELEGNDFVGLENFEDYGWVFAAVVFPNLITHLPIKYVHELQHALKLFGIEKTLDL